ncbi:MAG TPA: type II toxin-antitoxin system PemK/MazF family toxin [Pyrinomonadaceae bacterium]
MANYSKGDLILVRYPFTDHSTAKVRPAIAVSAPHPSDEVFIVPLTSRTTSLRAGEFVMIDWKKAGLNVISAVKRGLFTIHHDLIIKTVGRVTVKDSEVLDRSLREWLAL